MQIETVVVGPLETNCYVLTKNSEVLIIDPGEEATKIKQAVGKGKVVGILITHHHFDHIGALQQLKEEYNVEIYDFHNLKEGICNLGSFQFEMIQTPGHKEDSISFLFGTDLFVGDFIFKNSIGRTDLEGGDFDSMKESIEKIKQYPDKLNIYPGHGPSTNLGVEKQSNIYF